MGTRNSEIHPWCKKCDEECKQFATVKIDYCANYDEMERIFRKKVTRSKPKKKCKRITKESFRGL